MNATGSLRDVLDRVVPRAFASLAGGLVVALSLLCLSGCGPTDNSGGSSSGTADREEELPSYAMAEGEAAEASEENPQVVNGDIIEDYDYACTLQRPTSDWRFLDEENVAELSPDAMLGVINPGRQAFSVMIVERLDDTTLEEYEQLVFTESPLGQGTELDRRSVTIDGCPGLVTKRRVTVEGIEMIYRLQLVQRGDFFYNLTCWAMAGKFDGAERQFSRLGDSLKFVEDREPRVRAVSGSSDDQGPDWRIAENVYESGSFGFRLRPTEGWRLPGYLELRTMNVDASAGVVCASPTFFQIYVVEPVGDNDRRDYLDVVLRQIGTDFEIDGEHPDPAEVTLAGMSAEERIYRQVEVAGSVFDFAETTFFRDATFFRIQSWWPSSEAEEAAPLLAGSYQFLEWLSDGERRELEKVLPDYDANNAVGSDFSYRNGVFRDFEYGFTLQAPSGLWQALTGDTVLDENPDARLILSQPAHGIKIFVVPEPGDLSNAEYHAVLRNNLQVSPDAPTTKQQREDLELLVTSFADNENGLDVSFRLVTAVRGGRLVQFMMHALASHERFLDGRVSELINGFEFHSTRLAMTEQGRSRVVDHRLGFELQAPRGWKIQANTPPHIQPLGSIILTSNDRAACTAIGAWVRGGFDEDMAIDAMSNSGQITVTPGSRRESESTMAGLPARRIVMSGKMGGEEAFMKVWSIKRAETVYMLFAFGKLGTQEHAESESYKELFRLLE